MFDDRHSAYSRESDKGMWNRKSQPARVEKTHLLELSHVDASYRKGRNVAEGYRRGVGLEFEKLGQAIANDPDFAQAYQLADGRSAVSKDRLMNLFLILKFGVPELAPGHIAEYGSFNGGSAFFLAALAQKFVPGTRIFALDTFAGMPPTDMTIDAHVKGDFVPEKLAALNGLKDQFKLDNLEFVEGLFEDTAVNVMARAKSVCLTHIDCDIYDAVKCSYLATKPFMVPRGYYIFDDPTTSTCLGAMEAVEECVIRNDGLHAEQVFPHLVFRHPE